MNPRHTPESLRAHSAATLKLAESHLNASSEAYRKRSSIRGVTLGPATHDALAEAYQAWREYRADTAPPGCQDLMIPERQPDGSAPGLTRVHGYDVTIGDVDGGIAWDIGPEPLVPFVFREVVE
jgi:hypothetical protein